jgi:tetratricopeptide (TPR) repeat protein
MTKVSELKTEARREEAAGNHRRAIQLYLRALEEGQSAEYSTPDPGLSVRIADLNFREGEPGRAIEYYRQAAELYAEQGLITNAIAVCNKILRVFPYEIECYRTMARLHLEVGLVAEARKNLLHYVDTVSERGEPRAARVAMRDFLERAPDEEVAERLARSLLEEGSDKEALRAMRDVWFRRADRGESNAELEARICDLFPREDPSAWERGEEVEAASEPEDVEDAIEAALDESSAASWLTEPALDSEPGDEAEPEAEDDLPQVQVFRYQVNGEFTEEPASEPEPEAEAEETGPEAELEAFEAPEPEPEAEEPEAAEAAAYVGEDVEDVEDVEDAEDAEDPEDLEAPARGEEEDEEWAEVWPDRLELVGQYRELMSRARSLATEFGRDPPAWSPAAESETLESETMESEAGTPSAPSFPDIETGGVMSEQTEDQSGTRESGGDMPDVSGGSGDDSFGSGWEPWPSHEPETHEPETYESETHEPETYESERREPEAGDTETEEMEEDMSVFETSEAEASTTEVEESSEPFAAEPEVAGDAVPSYSNGRAHAAAGERGETGELGEKAELRRGLELLDELLELSPDNMDLRRRKVAYARRLADPSTMADAYLALAEGLADSGSRRSARILYEQVLSLDEDNEAARTGLARLDAIELQEKRRRAGQEADLPSARPADREARKALGETLWTEFEMTIRELPWLHAATQSFQAVGPDRQPALETFQMMAHYFMARGRYDEAAEILSAALDLSDRGDEELVDVLYYLGVARRRLGEDAAADELFDRVARVDADFRESLQVLGD